MITYTEGAELPPVELTLLDTNGDIIDFSVGYTFTVKVGDPGVAAAVTKVAGITGAAAAPNVVIAWTQDELIAVQPGRHKLQLHARDALNRDRIFKTDLEITPAVQ